MYHCIETTSAYAARKILFSGKRGQPLSLNRAKTLSFIVTFLILFTNNIFSQAPQIEWQKSLGGSGEEEAYSIQQTNDGGYIVAGESSSNDGDVTGHHGFLYDCWIVKLNGSGNIQWQKCYGGSDYDVAYAIQQTTDGGYIVAGTTSSTDGDVIGHHPIIDPTDCWILKLDASGNIQWQKCLGGSYDDEPYSIQQTSDGGFIIGGRSFSNDGDVTGHHGTFMEDDFWIVKLNATGNIQWQKSLGGSGGDVAYAIQQTTDGGFIVAGATNSKDGDVTGNQNGGYYAHYWIVKLNAAGNIQWQKVLGGSDLDKAWEIQQTTDGGFIIGGSSGSNDGDVIGHHGLPHFEDYWIIKMDALGNIQWQKSLGGTGQDICRSIQQTTDGGFIAAGWSMSSDGDATLNHGMKDYWILKLDALGNIRWQKSFGGSDYDDPYQIRETTSGGYIIAGSSWSNDGDVTGNHGSEDYWIVKLTCATALPPTEIIGNASPCQSSTVTYNIVPVAGASGYTWSVPAGWVIVSGQGTTSISVIAGSNPGNIIVSADFPCGASPPKTLTVISNPVLPPQVTIASDAGSTICSGTTVIFTATTVNGGAAPVYQWRVNGINVGTNAPTFSGSAFSNGDVVTCQLTTNSICANPSTVTSPGITVTVKPGLPPSVNIISTEPNICPGTSVTFTATALNAGASPTYQWKINGVNTGINNPTYTAVPSSGNYQVVCVIAPGSTSCSLQDVTSNSIPITVFTVPIVTIHPADTIVKTGSQVQLAALITGNIQSFDWSPASVLTNPSNLSPLTIPLYNTNEFLLRVISPDGCEMEKKATVKVFKKLMMPNAFTPNNDGLNDIFRIPPDVYFTLKSFSIYNRWGERIFYTTDITRGWDGTIKGIKQPSGVYVYYLNGLDDTGPVSLKGSFTLIR